ncbi:hypothetical protein Patl1_03819 [Pistacia atlantica]|uniref:Uncharacterized protein n=1 Tax=Pistacia atlantica TaxID=434234 RepID=A0ACC1BWU5_9ROSI|nr:hypothetical protein Patl1_03819 [Pistacia atlantica]
MTSLVAGKNHLKQVRDLAYEIEDAIEEFMLEVPDHFHEHKISQFLHDVVTLSGTVRYPEAMVDELVGIEKCRNELLDLIKMGEHGKMLVSSVPHPVPVEGISDKICAAMEILTAKELVEGEKNKTAEDMVNEYLNVIQMNLVHASQRDLQGRVFTERNRIIADQPSRRLSINNFDNKSLPAEMNLSHVCTLISFGGESCNQLLSGKPLDSFRFLRVLDLEDAALECFPHEIDALTLLRKTRVKKLPKKICKLCKLLYRFVDSINENQSPVGAEMPLGIGSLESLQKLSLVMASKKIVRELGNLVQLRKLGITKLESGHGRDLPPRLPCSLYLGGRLQYIPQWISSVHSLAKIRLKGSELLNCPLEAIQLYLRHWSFDWWLWRKKLFPELQKLVLGKCMKLNKAPEGIHKLIKLEEILLHDEVSTIVRIN